MLCVSSLKTRHSAQPLNLWVCRVSCDDWGFETDWGFEMCSQSFEKEEGVLLANCQRVTHVQDPSRRATTTHARYAKRYELDIWIYQNNFEKYRFGVCFVTCSRPPRRDFKLSVGVHDVPKTSRTRCDNARTTTSPYEKVCVKFQNIYNQSKTTHRLEACFLFQTRNMYRRKKVFRSVQV